MYRYGNHHIYDIADRCYLCVMYMWQQCFSSMMTMQMKMASDENKLMPLFCCNNNKNLGVCIDEMKANTIKYNCPIKALHVYD